MGYIEQAKNRVKKRRSLKEFFSKFKASGKKKGLREKKTFHRKGKLKSLSRFFVLVLSIFILGFFSFKLVDYVAGIREKVRDGVTVSSNNVVGFDSIPEYPYSKFIFRDKLENDDVKSFLSSGQSIYRLDPGRDFSEVVEYYNEALPKQGWNFVLSVPLESEEQKYGEYWVKDSTGIRIYSKLNDIWYQTITSSQAKGGLEDVVKNEIELQLLLSKDSNQDLRPDFPWLLSFSTDYLAVYDSTDLGELQRVKIQRFGSNNYVEIVPLGYAGAYSYDRFLENYTKELNKNDDTNWKIFNTEITIVSGLEALYGKLIQNGNYGDAYIVANPRNNVVYIFRSTVQSDPFLKFMIERIKPAETSLN